MKGEIDDILFFVSCQDVMSRMNVMGGINSNERGKLASHILPDL